MSTNEAVFGCNVQLTDIFKPRNGVLLKSNRGKVGHDEYKPQPHRMTRKYYRNNVEPATKSIASFALGEMESCRYNKETSKVSQIADSICSFD